MKTELNSQYFFFHLIVRICFYMSAYHCWTLTLLPDVSMLGHGLQEDHVTEGRTLQDHSLALNTDDHDTDE